VDTVTSYDADGNLLGTAIFQATEHTTVAGGDMRVDFERGRLTCP
jgi:hypothetical protein